MTIIKFIKVMFVVTLIGLIGSSGTIVSKLYSITNDVHGIEILSQLEKREIGHLVWVSKSLKGDTVELDHTKCTFGKYLNSDDSNDLKEFNIDKSKITYLNKILNESDENHLIESVDNVRNELQNISHKIKSNTVTIHDIITEIYFVTYTSIILTFIVILSMVVIFLMIYKKNKEIHILSDQVNTDLDDINALFPLPTKSIIVS